MAAAIAIVLVTAAATQASTGVVGYFSLGGEFEVGEGGESQRIGAVAVNSSGSGGASPGDVYSFGSGVRQSSASGGFIRVWGEDVVKSGPGQADETQAVRVEASGGTFKLGFGADTTADIAAGASSAQVQTALNGLESIGPGGVSVSGGPGDAGGTTPYIVSFDGASLAGADQPQLTATSGSVPLSGGGATISAYTINNGGKGFEICQPASGDECHGSGEGRFGRIAVDQASGDVYVTHGNKIEEHSATGQFILAWGEDVVASGPDDSAGPDEQQSVTVKASSGTFTLGFSPTPSQAPPTTAPIPYDASAATVQSALDALGTIGGSYSSVTVSGGPGDAGGSSPYLVTFHGLLGGDDLAQMTATATGLQGVEKDATVATVADGGGYEVCRPDDACKFGASAMAGGAFGEGSNSISVAPAGAPNAGDVLAVDQGNNRVEEFNADGAFVRAFGWDVDATEPATGFEVCTGASGDVCKRGTAGLGEGQFGKLNDVAEDSSGAIYTVEGPRDPHRVQKLNPAGGPDLTPAPFGANEVQALTVNAAAGQFRLTLGAEKGGTEGTGDITAGSSVITNVKTTKGAFTVGQPIEANTPPFFSGGPYPEYSIVAVGANTITLSKPANQTITGYTLFSGLPYTTPNLPYNASPAAVESALNALPSIGGIGGSVSVSEGPGGPGGSSPYLISFDGGSLARTDSAQIAASNGSTPLSGGSGAGANTATVATSVPGGPGGTEDQSSPIEIAIGPEGHVFVAKYFPQTFTACADGLPSPPELRIEELNALGSVLETSDPCTGIPGYEEASQRVPALTVNQLTGHPYLNPEAFPLRIDVFGPPGPPPAVALEPVSNITATGGTIAGTINPNGPGTSYPETTGTPSSYRTTYRVEYKKASEASWTKYTLDTPVGSGTSAVPFSVGVAGLSPKTPYELKVVATKPFTATVEEIESFTTEPAPPEIEGFSSSGVTATSADLHALINPQGTDTTYHFEYGTTPAYGSETPETDIGESLSGQTVVDHVEGLQDAVYHFRVVATNALGTVRSADQTFTFHPPVCPNQTVRQQTSTAYLPDCRAYELVSPEDAGGTTLYTGGPQSPYATNPPRLAFVGQLAAIPGAGRNPINTAGDLYVATRGAEGWRTRYIGPSSEEVGCVGGRPIVDGSGPPTTIQNDVMADPGLNRIIDWNLGNPLECTWGYTGSVRFFDFNTAALGSNAPYVWNAHGDFLDRWPTAVADVPGAEGNFACPQDPTLHPFPQGFASDIPVSYFCSTYVDASKDLNHFVFSTQSGLFGEGGLNVAPGSAYDNDTAHNTLSLISKLPGGEAIGQEPGAKAGPEELVQFPAVSADGSHILMGTATKPACKQGDYPGGGGLAGPLCPILTQPTHLYMRVNDAVTYDVSGRPVHYIGSTPDGTKVYFTSDEQLTGDDTDESTDLYMWSENGGAPSLTRISAGEPAPSGNSDNCATSWTERCDIKTYSDSKISTAQGNRGGLGSWDASNPNPGYTDNAIAAKSGDIYFYSPEQLVPGKGVPGRENLYVYHRGDVQLVAALEVDPYCIRKVLQGLDTTRCSDGAVGRLQVTPDGRFAAFITTSRVTAYDNHGFAEMYRYDAEAETLVCVSCRPDGSAPSADVLGSEGGRFITDDGRVFFDTPEPLDPRDTNSGFDSLGQIAGIDTYEFTEGRPQLITPGTGTEASSGGLGFESVPGLYGVSADGVDAYFGTFETLVGQDRNGQQLKFYDARTNGGFPFVPPPPPCAAADECHGPSSSSPSTLANGTGAALGSGGNAPRAHGRRHHGKKRHKRHHHHSQRAAGRRSGGTR